MNGIVARSFLLQEARALLARLARVRHYSLTMPMVPSAAISTRALSAIEHTLTSGVAGLRDMIRGYCGWLVKGAARISPVEAQRRFTILRMRFNNILSQFDIFADVLNQRSEQETGIWLAGLDVVSTDALRIAGQPYEVPPVVCYLDRGHGAAIRRARTRLPGGMQNPVAVIRIPRERMIGSGIASSLIHEVGHQGSALLDLVKSLQPVLQGLQRTGGPQAVAWGYWERWLSEVLADLWSVSRIGITATLGLIGVVSLPRAFVFRIGVNDPHPFPWIRARLSCRMGNALYPHPQWKALADLWESLYPTQGIGADKRRIISLLEATLPGFIAVVLNHRPRALQGRSLLDALRLDERQPQTLRGLYDSWAASWQKMTAASPSLAFAVIGQAKADGKITPEKESSILSHLLRQWALKNTLVSSARCSSRPATRSFREVQPITL